MHNWCDGANISWVLLLDWHIHLLGEVSRVCVCVCVEVWNEGNQTAQQSCRSDLFPCRSIRVISDRSSTPFYNPGAVNAILLIFRECCTVNSLWLNLAALISDTKAGHFIAAPVFCFWMKSVVLGLIQSLSDNHLKGTGWNKPGTFIVFLFFFLKTLDGFLQAAY